MTKHRSHSAAFKRQVAEEFIAGETLHALSQRHDISRQLIRIWVGKFEAGALDDDVQAAEFHRLAEVPPEVEWFANLSNPSTRRAYENAVKDFVSFTGIGRPEEFRVVTRAHIIRWR